jgi:hypothetical protein
VLARPAHQIHRIVRKSVLVEARNERPISLHPEKKIRELGWTISKWVLLWDTARLGAPRVVGEKVRTFGLNQAAP